MNKVYGVWFTTHNNYCEYDKILELFQKEEEAKKYWNECVQKHKDKITKDIKVTTTDYKVVFENIKSGEYDMYYVYGIEVK